MSRVLKRASVVLKYAAESGYVANTTFKSHQDCPKPQDALQTLIGAATEIARVVAVAGGAEALRSSVNDQIAAVYVDMPELRPKVGGSDVAAAMAVVRAAMREDPDYAWSWHCNIAMGFVDEGGDPAIANHGAARFLSNLADVKPAHELPRKPDEKAVHAAVVEFMKGWEPDSPKDRRRMADAILGAFRMQPKFEV